MKFIITQDQFDSMYLNSGCPARKIMEELKPIDPLLAAAPDLLEDVQNKSSMDDAMLAGNAVLIDDLRKSLHEAKHCQCGYDDVCEFAREAEKLKAELAALQNKPMVLSDIEQYRLQIATICAAAIGYWVEGDPVHPDFDTVALRDVAMLYAKYSKQYKEAAGAKEKRWMLQSIKQEAETALLIGDEIALRDGLTEILTELDAALGISTTQAGAKVETE